jgi:hypothetical protein
MFELGFPQERLTQLGESVNPSLDDILDKIAQLIEGERGVLIGMVNIHTHQAEMLMDYFKELGSDAHLPETDQSRLPQRMPVSTQRVRKSVAAYAHRVTLENREKAQEHA